MALGRFREHSVLIGTQDLEENGTEKISRAFCAYWKSRFGGKWHLEKFAVILCLLEIKIWTKMILGKFCGQSVLIENQDFEEKGTGKFSRASCADRKSRFGGKWHRENFPGILCLLYIMNHELEENDAVNNSRASCAYWRSRFGVKWHWGDFAGIVC